MTGPVAAILDDGRLHLQHGPIDLIIGAFGDDRAVGRAFESARARFATVLQELVDELPVLRRRCPVAGLPVQGRIAKRMERAVRPHAQNGEFITPMAAVAGAVAAEVLAAIQSVANLKRAYVNNGGDIALHLSAGEQFDVACVGATQSRGGTGSRYANIRIRAEDGVCGIATSGRGGRSMSLGIADSVTVVAKTAPVADAAATLIANAVDLPEHPAIERCRACALHPDSDLGKRLVVTHVGALSESEGRQALDKGTVVAERMRVTGLVQTAVLVLGDAVVTVGPAP